MRNALKEFEKGSNMIKVVCSEINLVQICRPCETWSLMDSGVMALCWCNATFVVSVNQNWHIPAKYLQSSLMFCFSTKISEYLWNYILKFSAPFCVCYFSRKFIKRSYWTIDGCLRGSLYSIAFVLAPLTLQIFFLSSAFQ